MRDMLFNSDIGWVEYKESGKDRGKVRKAEEGIGKGRRVGGEK